MDKIITAEQINEILKLITQYLVYIYPGLITYVIYRFAMARNIDESKNTLIKIITISFIYNKILSVIFKTDPVDFCFWIIVIVK